MALQKGQRLREVGQFEVAEVGQIKSAGDTSPPSLPTMDVVSKLPGHKQTLSPV
ncbi:hypothetical protein ACWGZ8_10250 [Xanthomonas axonopodis pv. khayae]